MITLGSKLVSLMIVSVLLLLLARCGNTPCSSQPDCEISCLATCQFDIDGNGELDHAYHLQVDSVHCVLILAKTDQGTVSLAVSHILPLDLMCISGDSLVSTLAGPGDPAPRVVQTAGSYLLLSQPEGSAEAFYWNGQSIESITIRD